MLIAKVTADELRRVCGEWATGVAVVTSFSDTDAPVGMAVNSFTSLSLDPPLVLFCAAKESTTWSHIRSTGKFAVNILAADHAEFARNFARTGGDKFAGVSYTRAAGGLPILGGVTAYLLCTTENVYEGGDHEIVVGRVQEAMRAPTAPLIFHRGVTTELNRR